MNAFCLALISDTSFSCDVIVCPRCWKDCTNSMGLPLAFSSETTLAYRRLFSSVLKSKHLQFWTIFEIFKTIRMCACLMVLSGIVSQSIVYAQLIETALWRQSWSVALHRSVSSTSRLIFVVLPTLRSITLSSTSSLLARCSSHTERSPVSCGTVSRLGRRCQTLITSPWDDSRQANKYSVIFVN